MGIARFVVSGLVGGLGGWGYFALGSLNPRVCVNCDKSPLTMILTGAALGLIAAAAGRPK